MDGVAEDLSLPAGWSPSELAELEALHASVDDDDPGATSHWRCLRCHSSHWSLVAPASYTCDRCGHDEFYNARAPTRHETGDGVWMFVPKADASPAEVPPSNSSWRPAAECSDSVQGEKDRDDPAEASPSSVYEWPSVDLDPEKASSTSSRRRRKNKTTVQADDQDPTKQSSPISPSAKQKPKLNMSPKAKTGTSSSELVDALRQLLDERRADSASDKSWNSRKGPAPGLKWRGGSPPQPPKWQYQSTDLRAYAKYERRVQVWQMQIQHYLTGAEAALMLFSSLSGEPEAEAEHMDLEKVNAKDGVSYILSCLKGPLEQKLLYQKRMLLSNYEGISRQGHETIRQFINRYKRVERDLQSVGISSAAMYDSESRGNRLLERCRLDPQLQRLVDWCTKQFTI